MCNISYTGANFGSVQSDISVQFSSSSFQIAKILQNHTSILVGAPPGIGANLTLTINVQGVIGTSNYSYQGIMHFLSSSFSYLI